MFNTKNISDIEGKEFDLVVSAGVGAVKWWANQNPEEDKKNIDDLITHLKKVKAKKFVLISTIDVYPTTRDLDEDFSLD